MIAFVLSGGGNRGASQAGALLALLERGIRPDLIVGTSVGALNGAALAANPTESGARALRDRWLRTRREEIFPGNRLTIGWRVLTRKGGMHDRQNLRRFICTAMPTHVRHFADMQVPLLVTATALRQSRLHLFGDDPRESLLDALLASTAIPPLFPPYRYRDEWLVDGAMVANLPLGQALSRGAHTIYALEVADSELPVSGSSIGETLTYSLRTLINQQHELERRLTALGRRGLTIHTLKLTAGQHLAYNDFSATAELVEEGQRSTAAYLDTLPSPRAGSYQRAVAALRASLTALSVRRRSAATGPMSAVTM